MMIRGISRIVISLRMTGERSFKTMSVNYISEYLDRTQYPILPSNKQKGGSNSSFMKKGKDITPNMLFSQEKRDEFMSYFPDILKQLEDKGATLDNIENGKHISKILQYVVPNGRKYAGVVTAETYRMLLPKSEQTPMNIKLGYYLGWCVELLIENFNITDDMMDGGKIRRNKTCWYRLEDVQIAAVNDAQLIETGMYFLLRKNFGHLDSFMRLLELFNESALLVYIGQHMQMKYTKSTNISLKMFKMTVDSASVYIISYLPVVLGMTLAGYTDPEIAKRGKSILTQLGYFYIIENDYMDCFGNPDNTGKTGRDIQTGRCRWPIVAFMEIATPQQKKLMRVHYGQDNEESVAIAKQLFEEVNIHQIYANYTAELYHRLMKEIEDNSYGDLKEVYVKLVETITCSTEVGGLFP